MTFLGNLVKRKQYGEILYHILPSYQKIAKQQKLHFPQFLIYILKVSFEGGETRRPELRLHSQAAIHHVLLIRSVFFNTE